jgi:hypothetical protein
MEPLELLARVVREGRYLTTESPEQVGAAVGLSGRTVRRIEDVKMDRRPRRLTIETLAHYYSLDAELLMMLTNSKLSAEALDAEVRRRAEQVGLSSAGPLPQVALRLARTLRGQEDDAGRLPEEERDFLTTFRRLEPSRQRIAAVVLQQLLLAQAEDRRRREGSGRQE